MHGAHHLTNSCHMQILFNGFQRRFLTPEKVSNLVSKIISLNQQKNQSFICKPRVHLH